MKLKIKFLIFILIYLGSPSHSIAEFKRNNFLDSMKCKSLNPILGGGLLPNCETKWLRKNLTTNEVLFNSHFSTDQYARRNTPNGESKERNINLLLFGCSFVVGEGLNDDETLSFYLANQSNNLNVYNYGGSGFGPQQMLSYLVQFNLPQQVKEADKNIGLYFFREFHVQRAVGGPVDYLDFAKYFPYYDVNESNQLVFKGTFAESRSISKFYDFVGAYSWLRPIFIRYPEVVPIDDMKLTAKIIKTAKVEFEKTFKNGELYVILYPGTQVKSKPRIIKMLNYYKIDFIDLSELFKLTKRNFLLKDGHPNRKANHKLAKELFSQRVVQDAIRSFAPTP